jgi:3-oxoacyl-[acyl-carrier protein] reductase
MSGLGERVVVITGAAKGIGSEIGKEFARRGSSVFLCDRNEEKLKITAEEINALNPRVSYDVADIRHAEDTNELFNKAIAKFGKVEVLVNNAGITRDNLLMRMSEEEWDEVIATNLKGTYNCIKAVIRPMMKQRFGRIINLSSVIGLMGNAGQTNYAASKAGVIGLTKSVAREFASRNVTCNAIAPGFIQTEMTAVLDEKVVENLKSQIPLGRLGSVSDVAKVACFLASDDASYITGQVINVDGGMVMA